MKSKNKKIIFILIAAIAFSLIGGFLLYEWLMPQKTTIYIFNDNYSAGELVTDDILTTMQVDSSIVVGGTKTDTDNQFVTASNRKEFIDTKTNSLRIDVTKGMPLTQSMLSVDGGSYIEMNMGDDKVAVTVSASSTQAVTDDLKAGSRVNIYATGYGESGEESTTLIFENMRVLSVSKSDGKLNGITLEVNVDESLKLVNAANTSTLYFGLVNGTGYQATGQNDLTYSPDGSTSSDEQYIDEADDSSFPETS